MWLKTAILITIIINENKTTLDNKTTLYIFTTDCRLSLAVVGLVTVVQYYCSPAPPVADNLRNNRQSNKYVKKSATYTNETMFLFVRQHHQVTLDNVAR